MMEKPNIINIIFDAGRGACSVRSREGVTGEAYGELPVAHRSGYVFDGWFTQADVNGEKVLSDDVIAHNEDVVLYAHYTKIKGAKRKKSSLRTQKKVLVALAISIVFLVAGLIFVNYLVSIVRYTDSDGAVYRAKKSGGVYSIYDKDGTELETNSDGYYLTSAGTQLSLDLTTGAITEYAIVDVEGSEVAGANRRILMFPQIRQKNITRIEVTNQYSSFTFYTDADGNVKLLGFEDELVAYDQEKYAYLCVGAGYPLTMQKLNTAEVLAHGYAEYGLVPETRTAADGTEFAYKPTTYTVTSADGTSYTVLIGDPIVSGGGYYVKMADENRPAVYIMSNQTYAKALLLPVEELITPMIVYPMSLNSYFNVENFLLAHTVGEEIAVDAAFSFIPMEERSNTLYTTAPFAINGDKFKYKYDGYQLNSNAVYTVLESLYETNFVGIRKLGVTDADLAAYGLENPAYYISFDYLVDEENDGKTDYKVANMLFISSRTADGTYFVWSPLCDVVAEVGESSLYYLDYETIDWVNPNVIWANLAYIKELEVKAPGYHVDFKLDNSASDQSQNVSSTDVKVTVNGKTPDYVVYKVSASTGKKTPEGVVYNFRQYYKGLLCLTVGGNTSDGQITLTEDEMKAFRESDDSECQLILRFELEDLAATTCPAYHTENNRLSLTYRFYRYSEGKSYMTINGEGEFFVDASYVEKLINDAHRVEDGVLVDSTSKT